MKPGIHHDISIQEYHRNREWISATGLKHAKRSMQDLRYYLDGGYDSLTGSHFDFGNAFELALLDADAFLREVAIMPTQKWIEDALAGNQKLVNAKLSTAYQESLKKFKEAHAGKYIINDVGSESLETLQAMLESCRRNPWISSMIQNIQYQASLCWIDPETGIQLKTRPDICKISKNIVVNLKTTTNASPEVFNRELAKYDYPLQAVTEIIGVEATGLMPKVDKYFWLVVEKEAPYHVQLYEFDQSDIAHVKQEFYFLLSRIRLAMDSGEWKGYGDRADNPYGILTARIQGYWGVYQQ